MDRLKDVLHEEQTEIFGELKNKYKQSKARILDTVLGGVNEAFTFQGLLAKKKEGSTWLVESSTLADLMNER